MGVEAPTKSYDFLPVGIAKMVVESVTTGAWPHFSGTRSQRIDFCPSPFRCFSICPTNTWCIIERKSCATWEDVGWEVELGHKIHGFDIVRIEDPEILVDLGHAIFEVDGPLAGYVVRYHDCFEVHILERRPKHIVHVAIS